MRYFYLLLCAFFSFSTFAQQTPNARLDYCFNREDLFPPAPGIRGGVAEVYGINQQPDGKTLVAGNFTSYNNTPVSRLIRLMPNGALDASFNPPAFTGGLYGALVQADGKIITWGTFTAGAYSNLIRLMPDGSVDASFATGTGPNNLVESAILEPDGKIVLVGQMTLYDGVAVNRMLRLNSDGSRDASFAAAAFAGGFPVCIARQTDGKYVIGGSFTSYGGVACERIARLNTNGSRDAAFTSGAGIGANALVRYITLRADGKIWIGGSFTTYSGTARNRIARLNANGSLDATTNIGTGASSTVWAIAQQSDGKIYIGGEFLTYNGSTVNCFTRLNADGSTDAGFNTGGGLTVTSSNRVIYSLFIQSNGRVLLGGRFHAYGGVGRNGITRIVGEQTPVVYVEGGSPSASITAGSISPAVSNGTNFGVTSPCAALTRQFTITNMGSSDLNLSLPISLTGSPYFNVVSQPAQSALAPGESTTFSIQAAAAVGGTHTATVTIGSDDCGLLDGNFKFNISTDGSAAGLFDLTRGRALFFDGTNDYVDIGNNIQSLPEMTFEAWIRPNNITISTVFEEICSKERINSLAINRTTGKLHVNFGNGTSWGAATESTTNIPYNQWTHIAATRNAAGQVRIYINGVLDATGSNNATGTNTNARTIGHKLGAPFNLAAFGGHIDELRIWSRARSEQEIRENMHLSLNSCESNLLAYYQFNSAPGSTMAVDATSTFSGNLSGMNVVTSWQNMGVNVGQDPARLSNSQSRVGVINQTLHHFAAANIEVEFIQVNAPQNYTATYQLYAPNNINGASGATIFANPVWTLNSSAQNGSQQMNIRFTLPAGSLTSSDHSKYRLYWRPMYSDGDWTMIDGTANSISGNTIRFTNIRQIGQYMIVRNSEANVSDVRGGMYSFDDEDDYIQMTNMAGDFSGDWTTELWFKPNAIENYQNLLHTDFPNQDLGLRIEISDNFAAGHLYLSVSDDNTFRPHTIVPLGGNFNAGEWYHLAIVADRANNRIRAYLNGTLVVDAAHTSWPNSFPATVFGYGFEQTADRDFNGALDEIRFWRLARSQNEIRENMHLTLKGTETGLLSYYQFNNDQTVGSPNSVRDAVGTNHGNCLNMTNAHARTAEVAVAGGVADRLTVSAAGTFAFPNTGLNITFADNPDGEIVVSRLQTEQPHGVSSIPATDADDEYFVVWNYGNNQTPAVSAMEFLRLTHLDGANTPADLALYKRGSRQYGNTWGSAIATATNIGGTGVNSARFTGSPLTVGFSQFVIAANASTNSLPIELLHFEATRLDPARAQLQWSTGSEYNNKGFWIERMRANETQFTALAWVDGLNQAGDYHFTDEQAGANICYYRLRQVDFEGEGEQISPIRAIGAIETSAQIQLFPNPSSDNLYVRLPASLQSLGFAWRLFDSTGKQLSESPQADASSPILQTSKLNSGLYWLQLRFNDGSQYSLPFQRP